MPIIVQKFGGTSVADADGIHRAARRAIRAKLAGKQVVLVASAMGDTTDRLFELAHQVCREPRHRELAMLVTTGEQVSIALLAMAIHEAGYEAISLTAGQIGLTTDGVHTQARIRTIDAQRLKRELSLGRMAIVAGYQGVDAAGEITALGRGASDTTALALAAVLGAEVCEIYTDVDGVYTADPRLVPQARKIDQISYDEMLELAALGAGVIHARAVEFGIKNGVPIHVRSSLTDSEGTMIVPETEGMEDVVVRGVALKLKLARILLTGLPGSPGTVSKVFRRLAERDIMIDEIIQNVALEGRTTTLGFTVDLADAQPARAVCEESARELGIGGIELDDQVSKVSIVGLGMRSHTTVAARMFEALAAGGIDIRNVSTSEIVISCIVPRADGEQALRLLHEAFALGAAG